MIVSVDQDIECHRVTVSIVDSVLMPALVWNSLIANISFSVRKGLLFFL
jgi:hypothetical protein